MNRTQMAVMPGAVLGSLVVVWLGLATTGMTWQTPSQPAGQAIEGQAAAQAVVEVQPAPEEVEPCKVSGLYPASVRQWCGAITASAEEFGVDPDLVAAVMLQESGGDPLAVSVSGAIGLLQVMPRDGIAAGFQCINGPCFAARPSMAELTDPEFNLKYGTRMLAGLFGKLGDWREALKSYGPMDVDYRYAETVLQIYATYQPISGQGG